MAWPPALDTRESKALRAVLTELRSSTPSGVAKPFLVALPKSAARERAMQLLTEDRTRAGGSSYVELLMDLHGKISRRMAALR